MSDQDPTLHDPPHLPDVGELVVPDQDVLVRHASPHAPLDAAPGAVLAVQLDPGVVQDLGQHNTRHIGPQTGA